MAAKLNVANGDTE